MEPVSVQCAAPFVVLSELIADAVFVMRDGVTVWASRSAAAFFGRERSELPALSLADLVTEDQRHLADTLVRTRHPDPWDTVGRRGDGSTFQMRAHGRDVLWEGLPAWLLLVQDTEAARRSEAALDRRLAELRATSEQLWAQATQIEELRGEVARLQRQLGEGAVASVAAPADESSTPTHR